LHQLNKEHINDLKYKIMKKLMLGAMLVMNSIHICSAEIIPLNDLKLDNTTYSPYNVWVWYGNTVFMLSKKDYENKSYKAIEITNANKILFIK
jgi:hypothetical protein